MRRSIAPSQLSATKRPRFAPQSLGDTGISHVASQQLPKVTDEKSSGRTTGDILQLIKKPCVSNCDIDSSVNKEDQRKQPCSSEYRLHEAEHKLSEESDQLSVCQNEEEVGSDRTVETENKVSENEAVQQMCHSNDQIKETREHQLTHKEKPVNRAGFKSPLVCTQKSMSMEVGKTQGGYRKFKSPALAGRTPLSQCSNLQRTSQVISNSQADTAEVQPEVKYFNVMWCKLSKKKHKKWEGDAILLTRGRTVSLLDMEGKEIGRGAGYKTSELMTLSEGQSLVVGGKEIEVMGELSEEDYNSGKCFQGAANPSSPPPTTVSRAPSKHKPFKNPQNSSSGQGTANIQVNNAERVVTPCFSPDAPGALVMPRPTQTHQWEHNKQKLPVVDIVVDPHLSVHLRPHQREGVIFLYQCIMGMKNYAGQGAILADEMGLGKTLQCITVLWTLLKQGPYGGKTVIKRVLVITPGSLVKNWSREFRKWLGSERLQVFMVGPDKRVQEFQRSSISPVMIISYEMFVRCYEDLQHVPFDLVVCDEGHRLKNSNIKTTNLVNSLATRRRIVLTGTPVQNDLQELYSLVDFCNPAILGTLAAFRHVYENPIVTAREPRATLAEKELGETRAAELNRLTSLFILRRTQDINNEYLPPKVEVVLFCKPSALQLGLYRKLVSSRVIRSCLTSKTIDSAQHLMCISALRKLCNHPALIHNAAVQAANQDNHCGDTNTEEGLLYKDLADLYPLDFFDSRQEEHSSKLQVVAEMLQTLGAAPGRHKIVLVSNYTQTLDLLEDLCKSNHYSFLRLDGQTPTTKRQQLVEQFNNKYSQEFVFLLSSKAGGVGLNLIGASRLLLYDIDWNPANDLQAMARVWRDGQRRTVHIYRLLTTGTIEEKMYQRQVSKQGLSGVVVDARTNNKPHFSPEELRDLFQLQENTLCDTHDLLQCSCAGQDSEESVRTRLPNEAPVYRSCQLGLPAQGKAANAQERNISMDELLEWRHIAGPRPQLSHVDQLLPDNLGAVTFAFWTESSSEGLPSTVAV